jgi:hypothetical protein
MESFLNANEESEYFPNNPDSSLTPLSTVNMHSHAFYVNTNKKGFLIKKALFKKEVNV